MWLLPERTHHKYNDITDTTLCMMSDSNISSGKSFSKLLVSFKMYNVKVWFLADRTNGRAYATVLRLSLSSSVCDVMYCG